jgi:Protein of unknown function (DUF2934)
MPALIFKEAAMKVEYENATATAPALEKQAPTRPDHPDLNSLLAALEHERIAALAYGYWQQRGCPEGSPDEDWLLAERNIRENL